MKEVTDKSLPDTGERMIPAHHEGETTYPTVYGEHLVRYKAVQDLVKGKVVLDIASGSGYGSALLGEMAKKVIGVDVDKPTVAYAQKNYARPNVSFKAGDGVKIPLADKSVEVAVSFETIEHIEDYRSFMAEMKRVLRPDGLLILSTPNDVEFIEGNHFHIHEFNEPELNNLVAQYFTYTKSYYQATWLYNAIGDKKMLGSKWQAPLETMQLAPIPIDKSIYFFMLCANKPLKVSLQPLAAISAHWSQREIKEHEERLREHINELEAHIHAQKAVIGQQEKHEQELAAIKNSKAWKHLIRLRKVIHVMRGNKK